MRDTWQTYKNHPTCACGEVLLGPFEITSGMCGKCQGKKYEEEQEYHIRRVRP